MDGKLLKLLAVAALPLLLAGGCAEISRPYSAEMAEQMKTATPVSSPARLPTAVVKDNDWAEIIIEEDDPVYKSPYGNSHAGLFSIKKVKDGTPVEYRSQCECLGLRKSVFIPHGETLDEDYNRVRKLRFVTRGDDGAFYYTVLAKKPEEAYILIYTDPARYGEYADAVTVSQTTTRTYLRASDINSGEYEEVFESRTTTGGLWWRGSPVGTLKARIKPMDD